MKRVLVTLILLCMMCSQAHADLALWGTTSDAADDYIAAKLGWVNDANNVEVGAVMRWVTREPWNEDVDAAGAYICFFPDLIAQVDDPSPDNIFGNVLGLLIGKAYVGVEGLIPTKGSDRSVKVNYLAGTLISLDPEMQTALVIEYATGQAVASVNDNVVTIGLRVRF